MIAVFAAILSAVLAAPSRTRTGAGPEAAAGGWADVVAFGAVGDGVADDTAAFARAAATGLPMRIPRTAAHYRLTGKVQLRASVVGDGMPEIRMYGADGTEERTLFEIADYVGPGLVVRGVSLDGQWNGQDRGGEWSHLVLVKGSRNVTIEGNVLQRPRGDGVLVGGEGNPRPSEDVVIRDNVIRDPYRCAVSVISGLRVSITGNAIRKTSDYVAAIDLEPNPYNSERVEDVEIARNTFDVPGGVAILLYSFPVNPNVNRGVRVVGNVARARRFVLKPDGTGSWERLRIAGNTFHGDPDGPLLQHVAFVEIDQDPSRAPRIVSDVVIEGNAVAAELRLGQSYRDYLRGVRKLTVRNNRGLGKRYALAVVESPGAVVEGVR